MADLLDAEQYAQLQADVAAGIKHLTVTRSLARQFYFNVSHREVRNLTGRSQIAQKTLVLVLLAISVMLIVTSLGLVFSDFGWAGLFAVPLVGIFWTILAGLTTELGGVIISTVILVIVLGVSLLLPGSYQQPVIAFSLSVFAYRLSHLLAQQFLIRLVTSSYDAYDMLCEQIEVASTPNHAD